MGGWMDGWMREGEGRCWEDIKQEAFFSLWSYFSKDAQWRTVAKHDGEDGGEKRKDGKTSRRRCGDKTCVQWK